MQHEKANQTGSCLLCDGAVAETVHQIDNLLLILNAQLQAQSDCRNGKSLQDMAAAGWRKHPHSSPAETEALTTSTMLHQTRQAWERLKKQIGID